MPCVFPSRALPKRRPPGAPLRPPPPHPPTPSPSPSGSAHRGMMKKTNSAKRVSSDRFCSGARWGGGGSRMVWGGGGGLIASCCLSPPQPLALREEKKKSKPNRIKTKPNPAPSPSPLLPSASPSSRICPEMQFAAQGRAMWAGSFHFCSQGNDKTQTPSICRFARCRLRVACRAHRSYLPLGRNLKAETRAWISPLGLNVDERLKKRDFHCSKK